MKIKLIVAAILAAVTVVGCTKHASVASPSPQPSASEDVVLYKQGLAAFRESTPEGYSRAADLFHSALALSPDNCDYALNFAQANLFLALEEEQNLDEFKPALESSTTPPCGANTSFALRLEAFRALPEFQLQKNRAAAASMIDQASRAEPSDPLNWYVSWKLSPPQQPASKLYEGIKVSASAPDLALTHYELGSYWLLRGRVAEARIAFEQAVDANPRHFRSYIGLAQAISEMDDEQDVEHLYRRAVELAPDFLQGRMILGDYLAWSGQNDMALGQYLAALEHNPRFESAYLGLAANYIEIERLDEAENACRKALELNPRSYKAYNYLGNVWYERKEFDKAELYFEESLRIVPSFSDALYGLGTVLWEKNQVERALAQFNGLLDYNPLHAAGFLSRAIIRSDRHEFGEALQDSTQAAKLYDRELQETTKSIASATKRGLALRAGAEGKKKDRIELALKRAHELMADAETHFK